MKVVKLLLLSAIVVFLSACEKEKISFDDLSADSNAVSTLVVDMNQSYLVVSKNNKLPAGLEKALADAGGALESTIPEVGIAVATSADPSFIENAAKINGIGDVLLDLEMQLIDPVRTKVFDVEAADLVPATGWDEPYFGYQWGHTAVHAAEAWTEGYSGEGVRVGVLDGGFSLDHPDLEPNINLELSADFTGEGLEFGFPGEFSHGSHTAGTIAAADNGIGIIGVAPNAELVLIKVLSDTTGSGYFSWILDGIMHAVNEGCDVVNMSLGGYLNHNLGSDYARLLSTFNRVSNYANQNGTTLIASAGNDGYDLDHLAGWLHVPSDIANVLSISATAPYGWAWDSETDLDEPASYTNFGQSAIAFAAPGGDYDYPGDYWWYDMVLSCSSVGYTWAAGTSMASPHATGVAALIIGKNGGDMAPAKVKAALRTSADDLGKPGRDDFYGHGRVNAYNAVK